MGSLGRRCVARHVRRDFGAGAGGQGRRNRDEDETTQDHLAFDDDQWLDDDETSPGVLS